MSKAKTTLDKAYGNVPKEIPGNYVWDWLPTRGVRYYYLTVLRMFTR